MKLSFYQTRCGNAARMAFTGVDGRAHNIFIDAGYERTFRDILQDEIANIINSGEVIDAWIVSHIHDDHIGGILAYIKSIKHNRLPDAVVSWYYNPPRMMQLTADIPKTSPISEAKSVTQGDKLYSYLHSINKLPTLDISVESPVLDVYGLKLFFFITRRRQFRTIKAQISCGKCKSVGKE